MWPTVEEDLAALDVTQFDLTCYDHAVYELLQNLVALHRQDPDRQFSKAAARDPSVVDRCPRLSAVDPSSGDVFGGYQVSLTGYNLTDDLTLHLDFSTDESLDFEAQADGRRITFTMPAAEEPGEVWIVVLLPDGVHSALPFTYEREPSPEPEKEATDEPSSGPSDQPS